MAEHIRAIRSITELQNSTIVLCLEENLGYEAQHIVHYLQSAGLKKWVALHEGAQHALGWLTTNERKESMCLQLREALAIGNISFATEFICTSLPAQQAMRQLEDELRNFCVLVEPPKTAFGKVRRTFTGKVGGRNDDLAIAVQLAITGVRCFHREDRYRQFRES